MDTGCDYPICDSKGGDLSTYTGIHFSDNLDGVARGDLSSASSRSSSYYSSPSEGNSFCAELWKNRLSSGHDAKCLDMAKRILLNKICHMHNIPDDIENMIQDNIWGNHYYD